MVVLQGCYTQVELPQNTKTKKVQKELNTQINFTYSVIDTFDNAWLPDEGYYYEFRFDLKTLKEDKIDLFLNMLYAKGYNIIGAWYRPAIYDCRHYELLITDGEQYNILSPKFICQLSDVDDSIIEHNFYPLMTKPEIVCPYNVEEYWIE